MFGLPWAGCWGPKPCETELDEYRDKGKPDRKLESDGKSLTIVEGELEPWNMYNVNSLTNQLLIVIYKHNNSVQQQEK
jgi:hypothetical protein